MLLLPEKNRRAARTPPCATGWPLQFALQYGPTSCVDYKLGAHFYGCEAFCLGWHCAVCESWLVVGCAGAGDFDWRRWQTPGCGGFAEFAGCGGFAVFGGWEAAGFCGYGAG